MQYAFDTVLIMAVSADLFCLKGLLRSFARYIGLKVNFSKPFLVPINIGHSKCLMLANTLDCQIETMPFTYLGLPLGTTRTSVEEFMPVLTIMEKRLMSINRFLTYSRRLTLVNSVFSALLTFYMCTIKLPVPIIEPMEIFKALSLEQW